jgi:hypothetical protein
MALAGINAIAEWRLKSGGMFFMTMPERSRLTTEVIQGDGWIRYEEIASICVRATQQLGGLEKANDLYAFRIAAKDCAGIDCRDDGSSLLFKRVP